MVNVEVAIPGIAIQTQAGTENRGIHDFGEGGGEEGAEFGFVFGGDFARGIGVDAASGAVVGNFEGAVGLGGEAVPARVGDVRTPDGKVRGAKTRGVGDLKVKDGLSDGPHEVGEVGEEGGGPRAGSGDDVIGGETVAGGGFDAGHTGGGGEQMGEGLPRAEVDATRLGFFEQTDDHAAAGGPARAWVEVSVGVTVHREGREAGGEAVGGQAFDGVGALLEASKGFKLKATWGHWISGEEEHPVFVVKGFVKVVVPTAPACEGDFHERHVEVV